MTKTLSLSKLVDLIRLEGHRGIIDTNAILKVLLQRGIPRVIRDVRGAVRLAVEREGDQFLVTQYTTALAQETIGEIY